MSKRIRLLVISLTLAVIMIASFAGAVFAGAYGYGDDNGNGDCEQLRDGSCNDTCDGDSNPWLEE